MLKLGTDAHKTSEASAFPERIFQFYPWGKAFKPQKASKMQLNAIHLPHQFPRNGNGDYATEAECHMPLLSLGINPFFRAFSNYERNRLGALIVLAGFDRVTA